MNIAVIIAIVVVVAGVYFSQRNSEEVDIQTEDNQEVLSEEIVEDEITTITEVIMSPTGVPNNPTNTSTPAPSKTNLIGYRYPSSTVINSSSNTLLLNSNENSDTITDWYKDKIKSEGMNVTSFVTTKTNDNILNKLVGADGAKEVRVEITKDSGTNLVRISVTLN